VLERIIQEEYTIAAMKVMAWLINFWKYFIFWL
jgi:hypothetical protein